MNEPRLPVLSPVQVTQILDELTQAATAATTSDQLTHNQKARELYEAAVKAGQMRPSIE
jgi:hypothetical protein